MARKAHILIAGGGIGGLTAAIILAQNGARVDLFEQASQFSEVGAGLQLSPNAMHVLKAVHLENEIQRLGFSPEYAALRHYKSGHIHLKTPLKTKGGKRYGAPYLHIHRADLQNILVTAATHAGVNLHLNHIVQSYNQTDQNISLITNKGTYSGDVLIGADGIHSSICTQIQRQYNSAQKPRFTGQIAWRGTLPTGAVSKDLIAPAANVWIGPEKHFIAYYLRGGKFINFAAVEERDEWAEENWSLTGDKSQLLTAFKDWDPAITHLIHACETPYLWGLFDRPPLEHWQDGRAALLGDAAHPMLPFMAQGAAMAIEDAWVISTKIISSDLSHKSIHTALKQYVTARQPRTARLQNISGRNARLFHETNPAGLLIRRAALGLAQKIPALQHIKFDPIYGVNVVNDFPL